MQKFQKRNLQIDLDKIFRFQISTKKIRKISVKNLDNKFSKPTIKFREVFDKIFHAKFLLLNLKFDNDFLQSFTQKNSNLRILILEVHL